MRRFVQVKYRNYSDRVGYTATVEVGLYDNDEEIEELLSRYASECAGEPALVEEWSEHYEEDVQWILADLS